MERRMQRCRGEGACAARCARAILRSARDPATADSSFDSASEPFFRAAWTQPRSIFSVRLDRRPAPRFRTGAATWNC